MNNENITKSELRDFSEFSELNIKIRDALNKNNFNTELFHEIANLLNKRLVIEIDYYLHFAGAKKIKEFCEKYKNLSGTIINDLNDSGRATRRIIYVNLTEKEIEKVLKLKAFL